MTLYELFSAKTKEEVITECQDLGWGKFKPLLTEATIEALTPIQTKYKAVMDNQGYLKSVLAEGKQKAEAIANQTLEKVKKSLGYSISRRNGEADS